VRTCVPRSVSQPAVRDLCLRCPRFVSKVSASCVEGVRELCLRCPRVMSKVSASCV
jgi:hypothetical protein